MGRGEKEGKKGEWTRVMPHPKLSPGCATASRLNCVAAFDDENSAPNKKTFLGTGRPIL